MSNIKTLVQNVEAGRVVLKDEIFKVAEIATRYEKLIGLAGHYQDGSCETVHFGWDDATRTANIRVGKKSYSGTSFESILKEIPDVE